MNRPPHSVGSPCALALLTTAALLAQAAFPLEAIRVSGNERIPAEKIAAASGLKIGARVSKTDFDAARDRLMASGAFDNVGYAFKPSADNAGYDLVLHVVEAEQLYPYRFEDLPVADAQLRAAVHKLTPLLGDEIPVTNQVLDRYVAAIQELVGPKVKVVARLNSDIPGETTLVFRSNVPRDRVAEVKFTGDQVLPADLLVQAFAPGVLGKEYSERTMRALLDATIRPLYEARGRFRVSFPTIETHPSLLSEGVKVVITVSEGESYSVGSVNLSGVSPEDLKEMKTTAGVQSNDVADFSQVKAGVDRVLAKYRSRGYLRARAKTKSEIDDKDHRVNLTLAFAPGPQFTMGKLEIAGLDATSGPAIRKMWTLEAGAPFQPDYPQAFLDDIRKKQLFDNLGQTRSETTVDETTHSVDVKLDFAATPPTDPRKK